MAEEKTNKKQPQKRDLNKWEDRVDLVRSIQKPEELSKHLQEHISELIKTSGVTHDVLFLYDPENEIREWTADQIYNSLNKDEKKPVLLLVHSPGGAIEPAYFISKSCKELSSKFIVTVPRKAKSAATLLSLGADEIHMGLMSQLGPIDPQVRGLPALGVSNAIESMARLCQAYPNSAEMFARYLALTLQPVMLGYFDRISESAMQYALRLLEDKHLPQSQDGIPVWQKLVYEYKDHGFVIDKSEATKLLGDMVKIDTKELKLSDQIYKFLEEIHLLIKILHRQQLSLIGSLENGFSYFEIRN